MLRLKKVSVETTPACKKNSGNEKRTKPGRKMDISLLGRYLPTKKTNTRQAKRYGRRTKNSCVPNRLIESAEAQVDNGGFAQKGMP